MAILSVFIVASFIQNKLLGGGTFLSPHMYLFTGPLKIVFIDLGPWVFLGKVKKSQKSRFPLSTLNLRLN